jgi:hypothetical protein
MSAGFIPTKYQPRRTLRTQRENQLTAEDAGDAEEIREIFDAAPRSGDDESLRVLCILRGGELSLSVLAVLGG